MYKLDSSQKDETRAQSADSSKVYRKPRAFIWPTRVTHCKLLASYISICSYSEKYLSSIVTITYFYCTYHVIKKILEIRLVWLSIGSKKSFSSRFLKEKKASKGFLYFNMCIIWNFLTVSCLIHASDVSRMRSCISILKLKLNPAKFNRK